MRALRPTALTAALAAVLWAPLATGATDTDPRFRDFAREMASEHGLDADRILAVLSDSERRQDIIDAISSPAEALPWHRYRPIFVTDSRAREGVAFWREHEALLARASEAFGVPPEVIVAIIGVETRYGGHTGRHRVIDALRTLAFDYPPRSAFFRGELEAYLLLAEEESLEVRSHKGSYAGAMGMPQFIASSYRAYAVDFNDNGRRDLFNETADAVGSVANYLAEHGWRRGEPVVSRASVSGSAWRELVAGGLRPNTTVGALRAAGVEPRADFPDAAEAKLVVLEGAEGNEYWVARRNFYVITRYNHSALYAMAVHQLGDAIRERWEATR